MLPHDIPDAAPAMTLQRLVLTGFMGSGKTTVGRLLAARLGWAVADLDDAVAERQGLSVPEIFAQRGETAFRAAEHQALCELLQQPRLVIALGGGAPETPELRQLLAASPQTAVVHLRAPFMTLYDRCLEQARDPLAVSRPLLTERSAAEQRYLRRLPLYAELAHHAVEVAESAPAEIVEDILVRTGLSR